MSLESQAVFLTVLEDYRVAATVNADKSTAALAAAALDHVRASRPHIAVAAEYSSANASPEASSEHVQELAQELNAIRIAEAVLNGNLPYRPPVVTTGG